MSQPGPQSDTFSYSLSCFIQSKFNHFYTRAVVPGVDGINAVVSEPEFKNIYMLFFGKNLRLRLIPASLAGVAVIARDLRVAALLRKTV